MRAIDHTTSEGLAPTGGTRARVLSFVRRLPGMTVPPPPAGNDLDELLRSLRAPDAPTFDALPRAPWLDRFLPEWEIVRALPRSDGVHEHPVDTHLLRTVREAIRGINEDADSTSTPLVAAELISQDELLLAALLHDIGEGHEGDHARAGGVIAERFAARAGLDAEASRRLVTAVEQHLLLPAIASRRDLAEGRVIEEVAATVGDPARGAIASPVPGRGPTRRAGPRPGY